MLDDGDKLKKEIARQDRAIKTADEALKSATEYVATVQPQLDSQNEFRANFMKRAHEIAGVLANRGIIERHETGTLVDKLAADPLRSLDLVEKVAALVGPDSLGESSTSIKAASDSDYDNLDAFEKLALYGDSGATPRGANTGLVE